MPLAQIKKLPLFRAPAFWAAAGTVISLFVNGYQYEASPNVQQIVPFIDFLKDNSLFPHDHYVHTARFFPSVFPRLMAWASSAIPLYPLTATLFLAFKGFMLFMVFEIAMLFFREKRIAALAVVITAVCPLTNLITFLGEDPLMKNSFFQTSAAAPFILLSIWLVLKNRVMAAFALASATYYLNGLAVNYLLAVFAALTLTAKDKKAFLKGWAVFFVMWAPWLAWYIVTAKNNPYAAESGQLLDVLRLWYTGHYFMLAWPADRLIRALIYACLAGLIIYHCRKKKIYPRFMSALAVSFIACVAAGFIFGDLIPVEQIVLAQFYRIDSVFNAVAVILAGGYAVELFRDGKTGWLKTGLLLNALTVHTFAVPALLTLVILYANEFAGKETPAKTQATGKIITAAAAGTGALFGFIQACLQAVPVMHYVVFSLLCFLLCARMFKDILEPALGSPEKKAAALALFTLIPLLPLIINTSVHGNFTNRLNADRDWKEIQLWAEHNTPKNAVFLTPPAQNGFRVFSKRSPVVEWIDGAAMHWANGFERHWYGEVMGVELLLADPSARQTPGTSKYYYQPVSAASILKTARITRADYIVTLSEMRGFEMPALHRNATFAIYKLRY
ncbi:MAG: DUF6798 domain-containing protein [Elusimicrobiaceae bacterium]